MAPPRDLRAWIALLEREAELKRISAEVDPRLEITEIVDRTVKSGGPALLFENVEGSEHPLLINQFGTEQRMCLALGVSSLDEAASRLEEMGAEFKPFERQLHDETLARAKPLCGIEAFQAGHAQGGAMPHGEAVENAVAGD